MANNFDVAVIGGGPAGSVLAALCAGGGLDVALYERERSPRYRIGESLLPATPRGILPLIGAQEAVADAGFVVKPGATFHWGAETEEPWSLLFGGPDPGPQAPTALNVDRRQFDAILLDNAEARGVAVYRGHAVVSIGAGDSERGRVIEAGNLSGGARHRARARYVVNSTGQMRLKAPGLDARTWSRLFRKVAVWNYWDHAERLHAPLQGNVLFETLQTPAGPAWAWFIPISGGRTSVGVVAPRDCVGVLRKDPRGVLDAWLVRCPRIRGLLAGGARPACEPPYDRTRMHADYSYASDAFWAPGLVQVGDAACFVDVLLSSGVHLATYGALLASRSIEAVLSGRLSETLAMNEYESRARQEFALFYAGLSGLYDMSRLSEEYIEPLRGLLRVSNGVLLEWDQRDGAPGGLNPGIAPAPGPSPEYDAARNVRTMRTYNRRQLTSEHPARQVPLEELPAVRNALAPSADLKGWRLPRGASVAVAAGVMRGTPEPQPRRSTTMLR